MMDGMSLQSWKRYTGTAGLFIEKSSTMHIDIEARWVLDWACPWALGKHLSNPTLELWNQDFDQDTRTIQFRTKQPSSMEYIEWDLVNPVNEHDYRDTADEDTGLYNQYMPSYPPPTSTYLSSALLNIGVIPRTVWGSATTTCVDPENLWYRMAVHHTASGQTTNGSITSKIQGVQAWLMNTQGYCDVAYQYLVGYDGTLYEGRPINKYSGVTEQQRQHCSVFCWLLWPIPLYVDYNFFNTPTDAMMARARELS